MAFVLDALAKAFHQNATQFFSTDVERYGSFADWFVHVRNPFSQADGHYYWEPTFFSNELEFLVLAILTFTHAYRHGARYVWLWLAILWHGYTVELVSYFVRSLPQEAG